MIHAAQLQKRIDATVNDARFSFSLIPSSFIFRLTDYQKRRHQLTRTAVLRERKEPVRFHASSRNPDTCDGRRVRSLMKPI